MPGGVVFHSNLLMKYEYRLKPLKISFSVAVFLIGSNVCLMTRSAAIRHEPSNYFQIEEVIETNPVISS